MRFLPLTLPRAQSCHGYFRIFPSDFQALSFSADTSQFRASLWCALETAGIAFLLIFGVVLLPIEGEVAPVSSFHPFSQAAVTWR